MNRLLSALLPLILIVLCGCDLQSDEDMGYEPIETIRDEGTGYYVELARLNTMSSLGYVVYVSKDPGPRHNFNRNWKSVINIASVMEPPKFYRKDGCYVLEAGYGWGGLLMPTWKDPDSSKTICFNLVKPYSKPN